MKKSKMSKKDFSSGLQLTKTKEKMLNAMDSGCQKADKTQAVAVLERGSCVNFSMNDPVTENGLFPYHFQWVVFLCTLLFRLYYVCQKTNWWILHPDEIFQTLEVAYSELHGYGLRPYEYMAPPDLTDPNITVASENEYKHGMYSLRSFLLPRIFAYIGQASFFLGYQGNLFLVWKCFHTSVTSLTILSVYCFTNSILGTYDTAVIASILCASSLHLNICGTHTLINSFLSPFVFFLLSFILHKSSKDSQDSHVTNSSKNKLQDTIKNDYKRDINSNDFGDKFDHNANMKTKIVSYDVSNKTLIFQIGGDVRKIYKRTQFDSLKSLIAGFTFGMTVYIRPDTSIIILTTVLILTYSYRLEKRSTLMFAIGGVIALGVGVNEDHTCYGPYIISPWQWFQFNVIQNMSTRLFGHEPMLYYLDVMFMKSSTMFVLSIFMSLIAIFQILMMTFQKSGLFILRIKTCKLCAIISIILVLYSLKGHKEMRFIHDVVPFIFIVLSDAIMQLYKHLKSKLNITKATLFSFLVVFTSSQLYEFINLDNNNISLWTYKGNNDSNHVNICLDFIGAQDDVTGVFLERSIYMSGAYTFLRHNVPIIALNQNEFFQFGLDSRRNIRPVVFNKELISIFTFSRISNYISKANSKFLLKILLQEKEFNYLVMKYSRKFPYHGYIEIYRSGNMKVLKRTFDTKYNKILWDLSERISHINNSNILNKEANQLIYYGVYKEAEQRLKYSLSFNRTNLVSSQLLIQLYHLTKQYKLARHTLRRCSNIHRKEECMLMPSPGCLS